MTEIAKVTAVSPRSTLDGQRVLIISWPVMKRIATWNVSSMFEDGKIHNDEICQMRWPNSGQVQVQGHQVFNAGNEKNLLYPMINRAKG